MLKKTMNHKMLKNTLKIAYFLTLFTLTACGLQKPDYLKTITAAELSTTLQSQDVFLLDVHIPQQQHIKGTDLFIPFNAIADYQAQLPQDKSTPIYLYCLGGPMGVSAARTLHELGYTNLINLEGGSNAWRRAGLPFE